MPSIAFLFCWFSLILVERWCSAQSYDSHEMISVESYWAGPMLITLPRGIMTPGKEMTQTDSFEMGRESGGWMINFLLLGLYSVAVLQCCHNSCPTSNTWHI